jgi:ABC-2 type transport system permease protein
MTSVALGAPESGLVIAPRSRGDLVRLILHQVRYDLLSILRNRQAQFFTLAMPVSFLVLFVAIFGNGMLNQGTEHIKASTYYVAALTTFGIVDAAFMTLVVAFVEARESGILRRRQATPQPSWIIIASRAVTTVAVASTTAIVLLALGHFAYGASLHLGSLLPLALAVLVGSLAFCALAFAVVGMVRSVQSAQPVAMAFAMPLFFISGVFVPWSFIPPWLHTVADYFPVRHLALAILNPFITAGSAWSPTDLAIIAAWGLGGLALAVRFFKWSPQDS